MLIDNIQTTSKNTVVCVIINIRTAEDVEEHAECK